MRPENCFKNLGKTVGLFGLGRSNLDILAHLPKGTQAVLRTEEHLPALPKTDAEIVAVYEGKDAFDTPREDILLISPSVRRDREEFLPFKRLGIKFSSDHELFFDRVKVPVFAVSGSDGKSTTTALCSMLLKEKFGSTPAIGNIGVPMASSLLSGSEAYAIELSSFMLTYGRYRVFRGGLTNISENHLNWHKSFEEYTSSKLSLLTRAREAVISADDDTCKKYLKRNSVYGVFSALGVYKELKRKYRAQVIYTLENGRIMRNGEGMISADEIRKNDINHLKDFMCALALTDGYVSRKWIAEVAADFAGLPHRAELFYKARGIEFIDSSIDTTPSRTAETMRALNRRVVLILGGSDKGLNYEPLRAPIREYTDAVIICGENRERIAAALVGLDGIHITDCLESAVKLSEDLLTEGSTLLLSPASASYDSFTNFEERGRKFKELTKEIFK